MRKNIFCVLIFSLLFAQLNAQRIKLGNFEDFSFSLLDSINQTVYVYGDRFYKKINLETFKVDSINFDTDTNFLLHEYKPILIDSVHYFVHHSGGMVFQNRNDSIVRIDNSFNHMMQSNSCIFNYESKIHRFGGYGFWSARNFITYYDKDLMEWEIVNAINSELFPPEFFSGVTHIIDDNVYFFNGYYNNPANRYENIFDENLWKYNFKLKQWKKLGTVDYFFEDAPIRQELVFHPYSTPPIKYSDKLFISLSAQIAIIDFENNILTFHEKGKAAHYFIGKLRSYYINDRFYYFTMDDLNTVYLVIATETEMIGEVIRETKFYKNNKSIYIFLIALASLFITSLIIMQYLKISKRKNKILLLENGLVYKRKNIQLDEESMTILKLLLNNKSVNSNQILGVVEKEQYSRAHNERIKYQKIEDINFKLKTLLGIGEELITSSKSKYDRRIRVYSIHKRFIFYEN